VNRKHYITVTREVHRALAKHAIGQFNDRHAVYHADGRVTFPVSADVHAQLMAISRDPELAVRKLLNMGADA
jgi:hypothetical protein